MLASLLIGLPFASISDTLEEHRLIQMVVLGGSLVALAILSRIARRPIAS